MLQKYHPLWMSIHDNHPRELTTEVKAGLECGIAFERYNDLKVGDVIEVFTVERIAAVSA